MARVLRVTAVVAAVAVVALMAAWSYRLVLKPREMVGIVAAPSSVSLAVADQSSRAGMFVVGRVVAPSDSWVVVTTPPTDDADAERVGLVHVDAGETRDVTLTLSPTIALNQKLVVTLHADRGIPGRFEFDEARFDASPDKPYFTNGKPVASAVVKDTTLFSLAESAGGDVADEIQAAPGLAALEVAERLTVLDTFTVDRVVAPGPSWIAMYIVDGDGYPVELVAAAPVAAGDTLGVKVPLISETPLTDKLLVVLQADQGQVGQFEFAFDDFSGSPDKPYAVGGAEVSRAVMWRAFGMNSGNAGEGGGGM